MRIIIMLLLVLKCSLSLAQGENNIWTFGYNTGLNFNTTPPTLFQNSMVSNEGCASVSDPSGSLLFYTNGRTVWNANNSIMPNGNGLLGNGPSIPLAIGSACQGAVIVKAYNGNKYYIFSVDAIEDISATYPGYLRYSVVDMSLNGGLGDVAAGQKNIVLDSFTSEAMTVAKGAGCYSWLITHRYNSANYQAYKIDVAGIHPFVASAGALLPAGSAAIIKVSPDGSRIAMKTSDGVNAVEVGQFSNSTGLVSNFVTVNGIPNFSYGLCFSPNSQLLYVAYTGFTLAQYNLSAYPNAAAINASVYIVNPAFLYYADMRIGPDGKIYSSYYMNHPYIGVISNPDNPGAACNYNADAIALPAWSEFPFPISGRYFYGFGAEAEVGSVSDTVIHSTDTIVCNNENAITLNAPENFNSYLWNDGSTEPEKTITNDGVFWVQSLEQCSMQIDTFTITIEDFSIDLGPDTTMCANDELLLDVTTGGASYLWNDGSTAALKTVVQQGSYSVSVTRNQCTKTDTIQVDVVTPFVNIVEPDTIICNGNEIILHAESTPAGNYQWSNGAAGNSIKVNKGGTYTVLATNECGTFTDSVTVSGADCNCIPFIPNAFSPNNDGKNDAYKIELRCNITEFALAIYNRFGQRVFLSNAVDKPWDGTFNGQPCDVGTYFYQCTFKGLLGNEIEYHGDVTLLR